MTPWSAIAWSRCWNSTCNAVGERTSWDVDAAQTSRWALHCSGGLAGGRLEILGLPATMTDVLVRIAPADGAVATLRLTPGEPAVVLGADGSSWQRAATYLWLGVEHILLGFDHLLFVLGLLLLVRGWGRLIGTITAFTLAHSFSLALATFGVVTIHPALVESLIALSIVFVAVEIVRAQRGETGIAAHWPWLVAFGFGLLHGLGFASALGELGLPAGDVPLALFLFNVGVELGQLLFIAISVSPSGGRCATSPASGAGRPWCPPTRSAASPPSGSSAAPRPC